MHISPADWRSRVRLTLDRLRAELLADRGVAAHWTGTLSPSALSTATAVSALSLVLEHQGNLPEQERESIRDAVGVGMLWLLNAANQDGGFGDTDRSLSNIATTMLVIAALKLGRDHVASAKNNREESGSTIARIEQVGISAQAYVDRCGGIAALRKRYGTDKTFVIPILTNCALAGLVPWSAVQALPFEFAAVPQQLYRAMRMPVVSYAIPALVAIGQARFFHAPPRNPLLRSLRRSLVPRTMRVLLKMQPQSGGYLEATPLTAFVLMSLAATGRADTEVARRAREFLLLSKLADGSWPIDTNLATWVTSLAIHALSCDPEDDRHWADSALQTWLLKCQHQSRHPFTGAEPGGWGWTDLSGAVPDSDDTPAALLALAAMQGKVTADSSEKVERAVDLGLGWLLRLQNRDGGWPTFCRGWGKLPFDRSSTDLTAHAMRALAAWRERGNASRAGVPLSRLLSAMRRGERFLQRQQKASGEVLPLWFGNQDHPAEENPVYGTGRVLLASSVLTEPMLLDRAAEYLLKAQNQDGGWGGGASRAAWLALGGNLCTDIPIASSVEETAIAVEGLTNYWQKLEGQNWGQKSTGCGEEEVRSSILRGVHWLCAAVDRGEHQNAWPIGFYFAKLWYHERLYATIFATAALGTVMGSRLQPTQTE